MVVIKSSLHKHEATTRGTGVEWELLATLQGRKEEEEEEGDPIRRTQMGKDVRDGESLIINEFLSANDTPCSLPTTFEIHEEYGDEEGRGNEKKKNILQCQHQVNHPASSQLHQDLPYFPLLILPCLT